MHLHIENKYIATVIGLFLIFAALPANNHTAAQENSNAITAVAWNSDGTLTSDHAQVGDNSLPSDMLFTTDTKGMSYYSLNSLVRVDAQTLQITSFYVDDSDFIRPLSWSPTGNLLAILRWATTDYLEICLVTSEGSLQSCFEDKIVRFAFRERGQNYMVTWSEDGRYLYFVTDYGQYHRTGDVLESWGASLVEADVTTGQTRRTLYQTEAANQPPPMIYWTEDLHYLLTYSNGVAEITNLRQNNEFPLPQEIADMGHLVFCAQFSPQGQYLTALTHQENVLSGFALVNPEGQIVQTIEHNALEQAGIDWAECPVWQSDDAAIYFLGGMEAERSSNLYKYSLDDAMLMKVKPIEPPDPQDPFFPINIPRMPLRLAADNLTLAMSFIAPDTQTEIRVLSPEGTWQAFAGTFSTKFSQGEYPIWFPPTESP